MKGARLRRRARRRLGVAAVEFALVLPVLTTMLIGVLEVGRISDLQQLLAIAAREGARQAATGQLTNAQVQQVALNCLKTGLGDTSGTMTKNVVITVNDLTAPGTDVSNATTLDVLQVTITIPYKDVRWIASSLVTNASTVLTGQATWSSLKDVAYPTATPQPPQG
jgi:Flp pilus assembly protein TadG